MKICLTTDCDNPTDQMHKECSLCRRSERSCMDCGVTFYSRNLRCGKCYYQKHKDVYKAKYWRTRDRQCRLAKARNKERRTLNKAMVLNHYGDKCSCCGENEVLFLQMDHVNGGGTEHRRKEKWSDVWTWIVKHSFPDFFQILCANCNMGKNMNGGVCPHETCPN